MDNRIFDSQAPMRLRGRRIDVTDVDITLDSNGAGNATASFSLTVAAFYETGYNATINGQTPAQLSVDRPNEDGASVPVYVTNGPVSTTVTVTVTRFARDRSGSL